MTSDLRAAAQQALEALESAHGTVTETDWKIDYSKEIAALRAALAEPNAEYERGVIDGMQRQAQSSVDRAVNRMAALATVPSDCPNSHQPVAWMVYTLDGQSVYVTDNPEDFTPEHRALPLYTAPPQSKPLTEEELDALAIGEDGLPNSHIEFARAIERAHGIKENT